MDEADLKVLKKRGSCTYDGGCYFKPENTSDCYKKSSCKDKIPYSGTRQTGGA